MTSFRGGPIYVQHPYAWGRGPPKPLPEIRPLEQSSRPFKQALSMPFGTAAHHTDWDTRELMKAASRLKASPQHPQTGKPFGKPFEPTSSFSSSFGSPRPMGKPALSPLPRRMDDSLGSQPAFPPERACFTTECDAAPCRIALA
jgi:hypothetical protein